MEKIEIDTYFGDKESILKLEQQWEPVVVFVTVNNFYNGRIWKTKDGWRRDLESKTILQGDDVAVIIELIEQKLGVSFYWISYCTWTSTGIIKSWNFK